ncbi:MAG: conjugal transfer protein, partial [Segatella oris]
VEDNFGQTAKLSFEFNSQKDKEKDNPNESKK